MIWSKIRSLYLTVDLFNVTNRNFVEFWQRIYNSVADKFIYIYHTGNCKGEERFSKNLGIAVKNNEH